LETSTHLVELLLDNHSRFETDPQAELWHGLAERLGDDGRARAERERLVDLMRLFFALSPPPDRFGLFPEYKALKARFVESLESGDGEEIEESFLNLYCHVHGHEAPYTPDERSRMDQTGGYWCHAGGLSPILKAEPFIRPRTVSVDFGAGNGLQGLLLQRLYPHRRTVQIEISNQMVEAGKDLQQWLGIDEQRVEWVVGDVLDHAEMKADFIYLYRPVRPEGEGRLFYEHLSRELNRADREVVIFSVADCLGQFLSEQFEVVYGDGHLTCFRNRL
jgi:hypothetical protein